jgi:intein/homing endonuclease
MLSILKGKNVISGDGAIKSVVDYSEVGLKVEYFIRTKSGRRFITSSEHQFLRPYNEYQKAVDLQIGSHIGLWRSNNIHKYEFEPKYYFYGYMVGDGCYSYKSNRVDISIMPDKTVLPILQDYMRVYGNAAIYYRKKNKAACLTVENKKMRQQMLDDGLKRVKRANKIPPIFFSLNDKANFIRGLMDSDGSCDKKHATIRFVNTSEFVVDELLMLLQEFGIIATKSANTPKSPNHSTAYTVTITGNNILLYQQQIGFLNESKSVLLKIVSDKVKGKTNTDFIPESTNIKRRLIQLIKDNKTKGGLGNKGKGLYANKNVRFGNFLTAKNLSYFQCRKIVAHLQDRGIEVPAEIIKFLNQNYFWDEIIDCGYTGNYCQMADIEVADSHNFIYNGAVVHNSQGSTYTNAIVANYDIDKNFHIEDRNRIKYTAVTRPKENLIIIL